MDNQAIINDALCTENCLARWIWKTGYLKNGYAIPWEIQTVNTAPDNFICEKENIFISVISGGLYELSMGIYCDKKPNVQILVNGDPIISSIDMNSNNVHKSYISVKGMDKYVSGNITGNKKIVEIIC